MTESGLIAGFFVPSVNPGMQAIERLLADIAVTDIPVLLIGESGAGKEVNALRIHYLSPWRDQQFLKVNCATLEPEVLTKLLGGGNGDGGARKASVGTIFMDEVCAMDPANQMGLSYWLVDGADRRMNGGDAPSGPRVICSASRSLDEEMRAGRFREELYFRINSVCVRLLPLRHRKEDIPHLAEHFQRKYEAEFGRPHQPLSERTMHQLMEPSWPGNVRELEHVIKKIVFLGDDPAGAHEPGNGAAVSRASASVWNGMSLKEAAKAASRLAERELILKTLVRTRWNRKRAAQELQISYKALLYKLKQIGVDESGVS